jgi:ATP-dependent exoDNAse (exonuclease V) beta subunit
LVSAQLAEERRLFYVAVTRPRSRLVVSGVSNDDTAPSRFLDDLTEPEEVPDGLPSLAEPGAWSGQLGATDRGARGLDASSLTAYLRSVACGDDRSTDERAAAAGQLARLAAAGVTGADPDQWYGLPLLSDDRPLIPAGERIVVSPSKVESLQQCPLKVVLEDNVGASRPSVRQSVGNLVHELADDVAHHRLATRDLLATLDARWPDVGAGTGWIDAAEHTKASRIVQRLQSYLDHPRREFVDAEVPFRVTIEPVVVSGRVDRLERSSEGLVVIDLKTGTSVPSKDKVKDHPQLTVYQAAIEAGAFEQQTGSRTSGGAELVQLGYDRAEVRIDAQRPLSDEQGGGRERAHDLLVEVGRVLSGSEFPARLNERCRICSVKHCCPLQPGGRQVEP